VTRRPWVIHRVITQLNMPLSISHPTKLRRIDQSPNQTAESPN
jgi:hypothetical protein